MCTSCWQRARSSFVSPDCSLPNSSAARFAGILCQISAAHSRGFTTGTTIAAQPRARARDEAAVRDRVVERLA